MVNSKLYVGKVRHRRTWPALNQFTYSVFYLYLDLDEIEEVDRRTRLLSYNRHNVLALMDRDHMGEPGQGLRSAAWERVSRLGTDLTGGSIALLTYPRVLNYVFNPVSFYFCRDTHGELRLVVAEVHNRSAQRHVYDLPRLPGGDPRVYRARAEKEFFVSPFIQMEARYEFAIRAQPDHTHILIDEYRGASLFFQAEVDVRPRALTDANIAWLLLRYPLVTQKTVAMIHWQSVKLWAKRVPFYRNPHQTEGVCGASGGAASAPVDGARGHTNHPEQAGKERSEAKQGEG